VSVGEWAAAYLLMFGEEPLHSESLVPGEKEFLTKVSIDLDTGDSLSAFMRIREEVLRQRGS
jgi:hypothetical protein